MRKYFNGRDYNKDYFNKIDTEEKAYILGFIYADGTINIGKRSLSISTSESDCKILYQIANEVGLSKKHVKHYMSKSNFGEYPYARIIMSGHKIINDIQTCGITERKTFNGNIPDVEDRLIPSLLLGIFDGDGSICIDKNKRVTISVSMNKKSCDKYITLLRKIGFSGKISVKPDKSIWRVRLSGTKSAKELSMLFYTNPPRLRLKRKETKFKLLS